MKRISMFFIGLMILLSSCYKDDATFTVKVSGYSDQYTISYENDNGEWIDNITVENGHSIYFQKTSSWMLNIEVYANDSIFLTVLERGDLYDTFKGKDSLIVYTKIKH